MFRKPNKKEWLYLGIVLLLYLSGVLYVYTHDLSMGALFKYGLLQPRGITGEEARLTEIETPLSWNIPQMLWFIYIKGSAVLVELFQYWIIGMFIAAALVVFVPWQKVRRKMGYGGFGANFVACTAGAIIPICSCGIVPVLGGMIQAGIPLGPTMAFLIAAPMISVPAVFITVGVLGWKLAIGRILGTFFIALGVGGVLSYWQRRERFLRRFVKLAVTPNLSPELQRFAFKVGMALTKNPGKLPTEKLAPREEDKLYLLAEAGILDRDKDGLWFLPQVSDAKADATAACFVLPTGDMKLNFKQKMSRLVQTAWDFFLQLNYYLVLAVIIAGAIKVLIPTDVVVNLVGGANLNSVLITAFVAVLAYVCTYYLFNLPLEFIERFTKQITVIDLLNEGDPEVIKKAIWSCYQEKPTEFKGYTLYDSGAYPEEPLSGKLTWRVTQPQRKPKTPEQREQTARFREMMARIKERVEAKRRGKEGGGKDLPGRDS